MRFFGPISADKIPESERVYDPMRKTFATCWISRQQSDIWDDDTYWDINVFDAASGEPVRVYVRSCCSSAG